MVKSCSFLKYSVFYTLNHSVSFEKFDDTMSISTRSRVFFFEYIFWIENYRIMKITQLVDIVMGNIFR